VICSWCSLRLVNEGREAEEEWLRCIAHERGHKGCSGRPRSQSNQRPRWSPPRP